ncbi:membrane protein [Candidatus Magnetobacterium bavaricum]|uniref:Membrane protein n=1 Tax=Candidatus Magnetobacterium bavaricum TaxID=29290 RepID=A0A0F3H068_9BACT|nr:membrane protein [Candidatus Magnetobacterium bavaricum]
MKPKNLYSKSSALKLVRIITKTRMRKYNFIFASSNAMSAFNSVLIKVRSAFVANLFSISVRISSLLVFHLYSVISVIVVSNALTTRLASSAPMLFSRASYTSNGNVTAIAL